MSTSDPHLQPPGGDDLPQARQLLAGRLVGALVARNGLRASVVPRNRRRALRASGYSKADLNRILGGVRNLDDLSRAWEVEGRERLAAEDFPRAYAALC